MGFFSRKKSKGATSPPVSPPLALPPPAPIDTRPSLPPQRPAYQPRTQSAPSRQQHAPQMLSGVTGPSRNEPNFQSAGYLPGPEGWDSGASPPPYAHHQQQQQQQQQEQERPQRPIVVNQHYYLLPAPSSGQLVHGSQPNNGCALTKLALGSAVDIANQVLPAFFDDGLPAWHGQATQFLNQGAAAVDQIYDRFNDVMTLIDRDRYAGNEKDLFTIKPAQATEPNPPPVVTGNGSRGLVGKAKKSSSKEHNNSKAQTCALAANVISGGYFAKVEMYANSRLPMNLPPLKLYIPTYPLLCLAAQYSERVYDKPRGAERDAHVDADIRTGAKAMVLKSVPMDHMNTIVFAIRGTATFMDWAVNLNTSPTSPAGFLDDPGNFCHAGFLSVAKKMIRPVANRLRQLLQEDPSRASYSLLITGHSAGGAVASLLYSHMLSTSRAAKSELNVLTGCFRRVHCVTFGTPPVSLLPLQKPIDPKRPELRKSIFLSFINEGDPVARADKAYVKSLLELFATPTPGVGDQGQGKTTPPSSTLRLPDGGKAPKGRGSRTSLVSTKTAKSSKSSSKTKTTAGSGPVWRVPPSTLSNAGRIVVLRSGDPKARLKGKKTVEERLNEGVVAQIATDEQLRGVIWGDPVCHVMKLYAGRLEIMAVGAVTAKGY